MDHRPHPSRLLAWVAPLAIAACASPEPLASASAPLINAEVAAESGPRSFPAVVWYAPGCTATRIGPRHFLTAAHCVRSGEIELAVGPDGTLELGPFTMDVDRSANHPSFAVGGRSSFDLAVVTVQPTRQRDHQELASLRPVATLGYRGSRVRDEWLTQVGYGWTLEAGLAGGGGIKRHGRVRVDHAHAGFDCSAVIDPAARIELGHAIVAEDDEGFRVESEDGVVSTPGDSGGPLLRGNLVVGVHLGADVAFDAHPPAGTRRCGIASRIDVPFVDNLVRAPVIDGIGLGADDVDPAAQAGLGPVELRRGEPGIVSIKGYNLIGATFTWDDGSPVQLAGEPLLARDDLGVDYGVLMLVTEGQPTAARHLRVRRADSGIHDDAPRAVVIHDRCPGSETRCDDACVDLQTDARHCGACGATCADGQVCAAGTCAVADAPIGDDGASDDGEPRSDGASGDVASGGQVGDPHVYTFDGLLYDQQAVGEFLLTADDRGFVVQARQQPFGASPYASVTTAVVAGLDGRRVGFYARPTPRVSIDGVAVQPAPSLAIPELGTLAFAGDVVRLRLREGRELAVSFHDGGYLDVNVSAPRDGRAYQGLLGNANHDAGDDRMTRDGMLVHHHTHFAAGLAHAHSWRLVQGESLFDYLPGETRTSFDIPGFPRDPSPLLDPASPEYQAAQAICVATGVPGATMIDACTEDVLLTGEPGFADRMAAAMSKLTPTDRQFLQCVLDEPDASSCTRCCQAVYAGADPEAMRMSWMCEPVCEESP